MRDDALVRWFSEKRKGHQENCEIPGVFKNFSGQFFPEVFGFFKRLFLKKPIADCWRRIVIQIAYFLSKKIQQFFNLIFLETLIILGIFFQKLFSWSLAKNRYRIVLFSFSRHFRSHFLRNFKNFEPIFSWKLWLIIGKGSKSNSPVFFRQNFKSFWPNLCQIFQHLIHKKWIQSLIFYKVSKNSIFATQVFYNFPLFLTGFFHKNCSCSFIKDRNQINFLIMNYVK